MHYSFDKYSHIAYRNTTNVFWHRYPYRVVVLGPDGERRTPPLPTPTLYDGWTGEFFRRKWERVQHRGNFVRKMSRSLAKSSAWKSVDSGTTISFYFKEAADCERFIDRHRRRVYEVYRPASLAHLDVMIADHRLKVRRHLFWARYPWCISFKRLSDGDGRALEQWYGEYFGTGAHTNGFMIEDESRSLFSIGSAYRMYFKKQSDVILTKLAHHDHIRRIERVVLASDLEQGNNESGVDKNLDRKGHHQARQ